MHPNILLFNGYYKAFNYILINIREISATRAIAPLPVRSYNKCPLARLCTMSTRTAMPKLTIDTQYGIIIIQDLETVFVNDVVVN